MSSELAQFIIAMNDEKAIVAARALITFLGGSRSGMLQTDSFAGWADAGAEPFSVRGAGDATMVIALRDPDDR